MINPVIIILAGGYGERLWPRSRRDFPKQFLRIAGDLSLLQETFAHARILTSIERIYIVTNINHVAKTRRQLPALPVSRIIPEPESRNTASAIALAAVYIKRDLPDEDPLLLILSADNFIKQPHEFYRTIKAGIDFSEKEGYGVIFGTPPNRPETGCGYIELGEVLGNIEDYSIYKVAAFKEKPAIGIAEDYVKSGKYLWNAGTFIWRLSGLLAEFNTYLPRIAANLERLRIFFDTRARGTVEENCMLNEIYAQLPALSIDHGILEKSQKLAVIPASFGLEDLGSWEGLGRILEKDEHCNFIQGEFCGIGSNDCIVFSPGKMVAAFGVSNMIIAETNDVLFICSRERAPEIKRILQELKSKGRDDLL